MTKQTVDRMLRSLGACAESASRFTGRAFTKAAWEYATPSEREWVIESLASHRRVSAANLTKLGVCVVSDAECGRGSGWCRVCASRFVPYTFKNFIALARAAGYLK